MNAEVLTRAELIRGTLRWACIGALGAAGWRLLRRPSCGEPALACAQCPQRRVCTLPQAKEWRP